MIKVEGLTRAYGNFVAVDDISFICKPGTVTGFLGPNGAGKTTTMRVMVGLTPATKGEVTIGGLHFHDIPNPGRHVGVLLDASAQHGGRTGEETLTVAAMTLGIGRERVATVLGRLSPVTIDTAVELLSLPDRIRGYGPVKEKAVADAKARYAQLAADLASPPSAPRQIAAE